MKLFYFPAVTFGGTFNGTGKTEDINKMSGLIVLDFDHIKNLAEVRQNLENDCHTFLLFVSPWGDGLKVVVKHNLTDPQKWQYLYFELEAYYLNTFGLVTDKSGKDISRMCFLPFIDSPCIKMIIAYLGVQRNIETQIKTSQQHQRSPQI